MQVKRQHSFPGAEAAVVLPKIPRPNSLVGQTNARVAEGPAASQAAGYLISGRDYDRIQREANMKPPQSDSSREERELLHKQSVQAAKTWGNTILGQRRKRLDAQEERRRKIEEERVKQDQEWANTLEGERLVAVEAAGRKIYHQTAAARNFHSHILMNQVLLEREKQIENTMKRRTWETEKRTMEAEQLRQEVHVAEEAERKKKELDRIARIQCADYQHQQHDAKKAASLTEREERLKYSIEAIQLDSKFAEESKVKKVEQKLKAKADIVSGIEKLIAERKVQSAEKDLVEKQLAEANGYYVSRKSFLDNMRKQVEVERLQDREKVVNLAAEQQKTIAEDLKAKRDAYLQKLTAVQPFEGVGLPRDVAKIQKGFADMEEFRQKKLRQKESALNAHAVDKARAYSSIQNDLTKLAEEERSRRERTRREYQQLQSFHRQQIAQRQRQQQEELETNYREQMALVSGRIDAEDKEFERYVLNLLTIWHKEGKEMRPLLKTLKTDKRYARLASGNAFAQFDALASTSRA